jgi:hypothetical protein
VEVRVAYVAEQIEKKYIETEYCPTAEMKADALTKPRAVRVLVELGVEPVPTGFLDRSWS